MSSDQEASSTFEELLALLAEAGFDWVVDNIDELVNQGVPQAYELPRYHEAEEMLSLKRRRETKERVIGIRPLLPAEKVVVALDEIERSVILPLEIASDLPKSLATKNRKPVSIEIVEDDADEVAFSVRPGERVGGDFVGQLAKAVQQLRERV